MEQLIKEISKAQKKHLKNDSKYCVRLNGTSDLPIEKHKVQRSKPFGNVSKCTIL